jgi:hypothetical protein
MTKIAEKVSFDGTKMLTKETHDFGPTLESAKQRRLNGLHGFSENRHVARVPLALVAQWARDAGIKWDDTQAMQDMLSKKLMSGDFSQFRVWEGRF